MSGGKIRVVGIDPCRTVPVTVEQFDGCRMVVCTARFRELLPASIDADPGIIKVPISPLSDALEMVTEGVALGDVVVLASGDPLFFGIGATLIDRFGRDRVEIFPAVSSMQYAFARCGISWGAMHCVSLHGRDRHNRIGTLLAHPLTVVLTDKINSPQALAAELDQFLRGNPLQPTLHVVENVGMASERLESGTPAEIATCRFGDLCCLIIVRKEDDQGNRKPAFGLREADISHSRGLITKSEVRAAALHALGLPVGGVFWDVGAGSGSVGLEAARLQRDLTVYSVEKNSEQQDNIMHNIEKYGMVNICLVKGSAPERLDGLPRPDRIFIGGSGGNLEAIIRHCAKELRSGGRVVVSAVLESTRKAAPQLLHAEGLDVEISRIQVERSGYPGEEVTGLNPISLVIATKR